MYEIIQNWMELKSIAYNFLDKLSYSIEKEIGLKNLGESYNFLLGFEMMIDMNILKWEGQWPNSKHTSAMLIILFRHNLFLTIHLRYFHDNLLEPRVNELLYLAIELINSSSEKETYFKGHLFEILFNTPMLICWSWAVLNNKWRAIQRSLISRQGQLLYLMALTARSLCLLT